MRNSKIRSISALSFSLFAVVCLAPVGVFSQAPSAKAVGTVKSVASNSLVVTASDGAETTVTLADPVRIVKTTPGQTDLKNATPIQLSDIQVGDRVFARGQAGPNNSVVASSIIVMKQGDIAERQQREREEWRRGVGGIVKDVSASAGTITIANAMLASGKPVVVHVSPQTEIRRYAPDSVKFDDAKPGTLGEIKAGDQLRARGTKNADGTEFTAQAIVTGAFRDVAGTVAATDAANNTVTINDLATKKPVVVKISGDSLVRKLPPFVAMGIAMRMKGGGAGAAMGAGGAPGQGMPQSGNASPGQGAAGWRGQAGGGGGAPGGGMPGGGNWRGNGGGPPDFQQMLARMPALAISDLNKGDAVMLVATEGSSGSQPTAITLLAGVEPILSAAPAGTSAAATILSPWNLGQSPAGGGDAGGPQ